MVTATEYATENATAKLRLGFGWATCSGATTPAHVKASAKEVSLV